MNIYSLTADRRAIPSRRATAKRRHLSGRGGEGSLAVHVSAGFQFAKRFGGCLLRNTLDRRADLGTGHRPLDAALDARLGPRHHGSHLGSVDAAAVGAAEHAVRETGLVAVPASGRIGALALDLRALLGGEEGAAFVERPLDRLVELNFGFIGGKREGLCRRKRHGERQPACQTQCNDSLTRPAHDLSP